MAIDLGDIKVSYDDWESDMFNHLKSYEKELDEPDKTIFRNTTRIPTFFGRKIVEEGVEKGDTLTPKANSINIDLKNSYLIPSPNVFTYTLSSNI